MELQRLLCKSSSKTIFQLLERCGEKYNDFAYHNFLETDDESDQKINENARNIYA